MAILYEGQTIIRSLAIGSPRDARRFGLLFAKTHEMTLQWAKRWRPGVVWVELPTGGFPNPHLTGAWAVICGAMYHALEEKGPYPTSVWSIPVTSWKKATVGSGNANKQMIAAWALNEGCPVSTQDGYDAYCIARAGRRKLNLGT